MASTAWCAAISITPKSAASDGVLYCNSGDWVESLTALVEAQDGTLSILRWQEMLAAGNLSPTPARASEADATAECEAT